MEATLCIRGDRQWYNPKSDNLDFYDGGEVPWLNTGDLNDGDLFDCERRVTALALKQNPSLKVFPEGSVVIAMYGATIGKLGLLRFATTVNQACCVFADCNAITPDFLFYWFLGLREHIVSLATGGGQPNISQEILRSLRVFCPSATEQRLIVAFLKYEVLKIDELIEEQRRLIELLKEKRQAVISHAVTKGLNSKVLMKESGADWIGIVPSHWRVERAGHLLVERDERSMLGDEEMLTVSHLTGITPRSEKTVNMFEAESNEGYKKVFPGDLVINTLWAWMGAMGVSSHLGIVSPAYHVYRPLAAVYSDFVNDLVRVPRFAQEASRWSKGVWSSRLRLYPQEMFQILFPVPSLEEQQEISSRIRQVDSEMLELIRESERGISLLEEHRSALISAAVTGKIDVRNYISKEAHEPA